MASKPKRPAASGLRASDHKRNLAMQIGLVAVVVISGLLSILAGYAFGMLRFRGDQALFYLFLLGLMVPLESTVNAVWASTRTLRPETSPSEMT